MPNYQTTVLDDSPWLYYRLNETSGTSITDTSGNSRTGTASATGLTYSQAGALKSDPNNAILFDNSTNTTPGNITTPTTSIPGGNNAWTLECWFKTATLPGASRFYVLMYLGDPAAHEAALYLDGSNSGKVTFFLDGSTMVWSTIPTINTYYHLACTYAGGTGGAANLYVNGSSVANTTATVTLSTQTTPNIAQEGSNGNNAYGTLDEVAIYASALASSRISAHYNAGNSPHNSVSDGFGGMFS